jgi:uncharacterized protein (DUF2384 family)
MKKNKEYIIQSETLNMASEPMTIYLPASFLKNNVLDNIAQNSKELFVKVLNITGLTIKILSENIFEITPKTFIKYKNNETKIPSRIAELAIELSTLYELGNVVFGSSDVFNQWLAKENPFFNNNKPAQYLNTSTGIHLIYEELKRIEFGATA